MRSARCRIMRLCHLICPKNRSNAFAFFGVGAFMTASIFSGSIAMPLLLTICPSSAPLVIPKSHLAGFRLSRAGRQCSRHKWTCRAPYTVKSSKYTCMNAGMYSPNTYEMIRWKVVGVVFNLNIMTTVTKTPLLLQMSFFLGRPGASGPGCNH